MKNKWEKEATPPPQKSEKERKEENKQERKKERKKDRKKVEFQFETLKNYQSF